MPLRRPPLPPPSLSPTPSGGGLPQQEEEGQEAAVQLHPPAAQHWNRRQGRRMACIRRKYGGMTPKKPLISKVWTMHLKLRKVSWVIVCLQSMKFRCH